jgi:hypothetical protein
LRWQAINPARDFGPRLFSAFLYGHEVFTAANYYFVVPLLAPFFGCLVGATTYDVLVYEGDGSRIADALGKDKDEFLHEEIDGFADGDQEGIGELRLR